MIPTAAGVSADNSGISHPGAQIEKQAGRCTTRPTCRGVHAGSGDPDQNISSHERAKFLLGGQYKEEGGGITNALV